MVLDGYFWTIVAGILCGAGFILLAVFGSILIGLVLNIFVNRIKVENPYLLIVKYQDNSIEKSLDHIISASVKKHFVKFKSVINGCDYEITYEVRIKETDMNFITNISDMTGVKSAITLSYDGNFTA
ncbi:MULTISPECIES: hypothetical protein [Bacillaceae]|uniref:DUF4956 domain-containing protein n=1 Tax=Domibacillus aminovorans TaxID=29332 RepID=A0A177KUT4_9BACI|nr:MULTISPECIES: hypothetical protein [Bacillaceae]OAH57099.1 hypothetical protein AWH48_19425 [Domibacillus aminovorans]